MQARSSKTFAENHLAMLALAIGLLAIAVTLVVAGVISSNNENSSAQVAQPAADKHAVSIPSGMGFDPGYVNIKTERMNWGLGVRLDAGNVSASVVRQEWGLGVGFDPGFVSRQSVPQLSGNEIGLTEH